MAFIDEIKDEIKDRLEEYEGITEYVCDLGYALTQYENANGSWLIYYDKCKEFICENFWECEAFFNYHKAEFGEAINPFEDSGNKFTTVMFIEAVASAYAQAIQNSSKYDWNSEVVVDRDFIDEAILGLDNVTELW